MGVEKRNTRDLSLAEWTQQERERAVWEAVAAGVRDGQRAHLDERGTHGQGFAAYRRGVQS